MNNPQTPSVPMVEARSLGRSFGDEATVFGRMLTRERPRRLQAVDNVSFSIAKGETLALVGESGCGKSTVARMLVGLTAPSQGTIRFDGDDMTPRRMNATRHRRQMVFQLPFASLNPRWTAGRIIAEPLRTLQPGSNHRRRVDELLDMVGMPSNARDKLPHQFSGGQCQRIAIARALSTNPDFIVCDEPTSALDVSIQAQILNLLKTLQTDLGLTYLFISHHLSVVRFISTRVGVMYLGRLVELAPTEELFASPRHPYTRMLLDAEPSMTRIRSPKNAVKGELPDPYNPPEGCAFHPRCPMKVDACTQQAPEFRACRHPNGQPDGRRIACGVYQDPTHDDARPNNGS